MSDTTDHTRKWIEEEPTPIRRRVMACSLRVYPSAEQRGPLRGGLGDAAAICDLIAKEIAAGGRPSKLRREMADVATRCANEIWLARDEVEVPHG